MAVLRRFGRWLERRGWGLRQAWFTGLAGIVVGYTTITTAAESSGAERIVASIIGVLCALIGVVFAAAVIVLRREQPKTSKTRVRDTSFRWPTGRGRGDGAPRSGDVRSRPMATGHADPAGQAEAAEHTGQPDPAGQAEATEHTGHAEGTEHADERRTIGRRRPPRRV